MPSYVTNTLSPSESDVDELKLADPLTVRPTAFEEGPAIDLVIERAREVKVFGDQSFSRCAILARVCLVAGPSCRYRIVSCAASYGQWGSVRPLFVAHDRDDSQDLDLSIGGRFLR